MMAPGDMLDRATEAEVAAAAAALKSARDRDELVAAWWSRCDNFTGDTRIRLQGIYTRMLHKFAPMGRAG